MSTMINSKIEDLKEKIEILDETIRIMIWKMRHQKEFLEKYKDSKLVNPDVIRIYRNGNERKIEEPEHSFTEEELQEIKRSLEAKAIKKP